MEDMPVPFAIFEGYFCYVIVEIFNIQVKVIYELTTTHLLNDKQGQASLKTKWVQKLAAAILGLFFFFVNKNA